jgi:regulator of sirC expression with transglutaminase-like and TPR domain
LARAALLIAREEYPGLDPATYERQLDDMSRSISKLVGPGSYADERLSAIDHELFVNRGFHGNDEDYYDPRNSFLNEVLDRKTGIPITISIIYLELCWRHGLAAVGVGLPGHFVVGVEVEGREKILIDPFERGERLDQEACVARVRRVYGNRATFHFSMLSPVSRRQTLFRVLNNLKNVYLRSGDYGRTYAAIDRMILLNPRAATEIRDRAAVAHQLGLYGQACSDYHLYLELVPQASDADDVRKALASVVARRFGQN